MQSKGNILNRPMKSVRDKNYSLRQEEEVKQTQELSHKEQKLNQIHEYRRQAILGNRSERKALNNNFFNQAMELQNAKRAKEEKLKQ